MIKNEDGLGQQIFKGTIWILTLEISSQALQFLKTFYAARILTPSDFGVIGFAFLSIAVIDMLSTTGMREAIIQSSHDLQSYLDTVWLIELGKGIAVAVLTWFLAPLAAVIHPSGNEELTREVIRFVGYIYFVQRCTNVGVLYFEKQMQFNKYFVYQFAGTFTDVLVSMLLVYLRHDVWALFYGILAGGLARVLFSFLMVRYRPGLHFSLQKARELCTYGRHIFKARFFSFLGLQSDSMIVTSFFPVATFGIYQMAFRIGNLPMAQVSTILSRLAFPSFSKIQGNHLLTKEYFLTACNAFAVLLLPAVVLVFCLIPEFTTLFLGLKWSGISQVVQVFIVSAFIRVILSLIDSYFSASGSPKESANLQLFRFLIFAVLVFPIGYYFGIVGVALSNLAGLLIVLVIFLMRACRRMEIRPREIMQSLIFPFFFAAGVGVLSYGLKSYIDGTTLSGFFSLVAAILFLFGTLGWLFHNFTGAKLLEKTLILVQSLKR